MADLGARMGEEIGREAFKAPSVNDIEKGRGLPSDDFVRAAALVFRVEPAWLQAQVDIERLGEVRAQAIAAQLRGDPASKVVAIKAHGLSVSATAQAEPRLLRLPFPGEVGAFRSIIRATSKRSPHAHSGAEAARSLCRRSPASV